MRRLLFATDSVDVWQIDENLYLVHDEEAHGPEHCRLIRGQHALAACLAARGYDFAREVGQSS
jgi:hypothetical protein